MSIKHEEEEGEQVPINTHVYFSVASTELGADEVVARAAEDAQEPGTLGEPEAAVAVGADKVDLVDKEPQRWRVLSLFLKKKFIENFLPIGFAVALIISMSYPPPGAAAAKIIFQGVLVVQAVNNVNVFFVSGITLNVNALKEIKEHWKAVVFGMAAILFLTPLLGFIFIAIPLEPREFAVGLAIFCCVPTTLGVGVALTTAAGGNSSVSLFLTVTTNIIGILTVPYILQYVILQGSGATNVLSFNPVNVFVKLIFTVLVPSLLGFATNRFSSVARSFVAKRRTELSMWSTLNLVCIIWQTLSSAAPLLQKQSAVNIIIVLVLSISLHGLLLAIIFLTTTYALPLPIKERIAVTIMAAQKSAPVAVTLISYITTDASVQGLLAIPALIGQLCQIFIGSALIAKFRQLIKAAKEEKEQGKVAGGLSSVLVVGVASKRCEAVATLSSHRAAGQ